MEVIADTMDEVECGLEFITRILGENAFLMQFFKVAGAKECVGEPEEVVVVAEAAGALFEVGFLEEDGAGVFFVARFEVVLTVLKEGVEFFLDAIFAEFLFERLEELFVAAEVA